MQSQFMTILGCAGAMYGAPAYSVGWQGTPHRCPFLFVPHRSGALQGMVMAQLAGSSVSRAISIHISPITGSYTAQGAPSSVKGTVAEFFIRRLIYDELSVLSKSGRIAQLTFSTERAMSKGSNGGGKGGGGGKVASDGKGGGGSGTKGSGQPTRGYGPPGGWPSTVPGVPSGGNRGNAPAKR